MLLDEEDAEKSCWETSSLESLAKLKLDFTFVHGLEQVAAAEDSHIVPCDIAYHPTRCRNRQAILNLGQHKLITTIGYCSHVALIGYCMVDYKLWMLLTQEHFSCD